MDTFGHVNNACYLTYFEEARIAFMNDLVGWKYDWSKNGVIVARAEIDYRLPVDFRNELYVYTDCIKVGTKSFTLSYRMVRVNKTDEQDVATGLTVLVMYDYEKGNSVPVPDDWRKRLEKY
jgi:acyl-CoA thioester hydrolase